MKWPVQDPTKWHRYFVWFPTYYENHFVWLEWMERRVYFSHGLTGNSYEYRWIDDARSA
jgi:hypothetical protein